MGFLICKDKEITPNYLLALFATKSGLNLFESIKKGGLQKRINLRDVENLLIPFPPKNIQERVGRLILKAFQNKKQKEYEAQKLLDSINDYVLHELGISLPELKDKMAYVVDSDEVKNSRCDSYYYQPKFEKVEEAVTNGKFEVKELKEITNKLLSGQRPKGGVRQIEEGIPSLGGEHVLSDGKIAITGLKFIPKEFHKKQLKSKVHSNSRQVITESKQN